jgi:hypothetical protein
MGGGRSDGFIPLMNDQDDTITPQPPRARAVCWAGQTIGNPHQAIWDMLELIMANIQKG